MAQPSSLSQSLRRIETQLAGPLEGDVRRNMWVEIVSAVLYGVFMAALLFIPAVLVLAGMVALLAAWVISRIPNSQRKMPN